MDPFDLWGTEPPGTDPAGSADSADDAVDVGFTDAGGAGEQFAADDHLWVHDDGRIWDLGPADVDTDADGIEDSLTRNGPDGLTVYTDSDHDGQVDKITRVAADGSFSAQALDPDSGTWVSTDSGRLD
ncbi:MULTISPECIES: DUF6802 family protein [unclassified Gordonia (in: high G+C Gram-positive bacteria)]